MTKKHFIALADYLRIELRHVTPGLSPAQIEAVNMVVADFCESQNPRFDRARWLAYVAGQCGPNGGALARAESFSRGYERWLERIET